MPKRIQMTRRKPWRHLHPDAVIVARGHDWGNPYRVGEPVMIETPSVYDKGAIYGYGPTITPEIAVLLFRIWVSGRLEEQIRHELGGKDLACWCPLVGADGKPVPCHADVLLEISNSEEPR